MSTIAPEKPADTAPAEKPADPPKAAIPPGLQIPLFENRQVTKIEVQVSGKITFNLENPADLELWHRLRLGSQIGLSVSGAIRKKNSRIANDKEGYSTETIQTAVVAIDTLTADPAWKPAV